ncbi:hypothetical protein GCM10010394_25680 [Streptomyces crystallinus]|uniref:Uncharacterized protein n=1 Tax=Streptomyces crystallinus TaxID=68191 RepID=A0ABN1FPG5_9ACTN
MRSGKEEGVCPPPDGGQTPAVYAETGDLRVHRIRRPGQEKAAPPESLGLKRA